MISFNSGSDINTLWDKFSKEFIYLFIADMFGYSQDVTKKKMKVALEDAELKSREEKQAEEDYKKYSEEAYKSWKTEHAKHVGSLTPKGWLYTAIAGFACATVFLAGACILVGCGVVSGGITLSGAVALGLLALACIVATGAVVFASQSIVAAANGGIANNFDSIFKTIWTGGKGNVDEYGNTKDKDSWLAWIVLDDKSVLKDKAKHEYNQALATKQQMILQDCQREIQNIMNTKYSEEQNNQSTAMDNFNKVLKDITNLTLVR
ncbi:MAG: hypothetical protein AMS24_00320 [Chlamydiae bacterium SM23_39]|nr:MAG: hypothetical protein AMS24_00320 [Chlamydiae bacterium SM23_39]